MRWLAWLSTVNLIDVLNGYLLLTFVVGTLLRWRNYRAIVGLVIAFPNRWPRLLILVRQHRAIFVRWPTLLPIGATLALWLASTLASRILWSQAEVSASGLWGRWLAFASVVLLAGVMLYLDFQAVFRFGRFDRTALEQDLDKAEHWLQSWHAPALRVLTFGLIHPRRIVNNQVRDALIKASLVVNGQMWRWCLQIGARLAFGLAVWLAWVSSLRG